MDEPRPSAQAISGAHRPRSLKIRLLIGVIPPVVLILLTTGYFTHRISNSYISTALERNAQVQVMAMAHEINSLFERCKSDLLYVSQGPVDAANMHAFIVQNAQSGGIPYREFAFISQKDPNHHYFIAKKNRIVALSLRDIAGIRPNPLLLYEQVQHLTKDEVYISPVTEVEYPFPENDNPNQRFSSRVIYLAMRFTPQDQGRHGYLLLSFDIRLVRNILSLYNSPKSPLWAYPRTSELRYSYMFDKEGWILFQSQDPDKPEADLSTETVRLRFSGTLGRPAMPSAFRPASAFGNFWKMVADVREAKHGLLRGKDGFQIYGETKAYYQAYAPILFKPGPDLASIVYGGVAYTDRSRLTDTNSSM